MPVSRSIVPRHPAAASKAESSPRKRGRPAKALTGDGVPRDRILRAAASLFRRNGYRGTTVRDIADDVGLLSGSLFHHFASKEEMLLEIMREAFLSVCVAHEIVLAQEPDPVTAFRRLLQGEISAIVSDERRDYHAVVYLDWREAPESARAELERYRRRYQNCWLRALVACDAAGRLRCDPVMGERIINGALRSVTTWFRQDGRCSTEAFGDMFAHLFLDDA